MTFEVSEDAHDYGYAAASSSLELAGIMSNISTNKVDLDEIDVEKIEELVCKFKYSCSQFKQICDDKQIPKSIYTQFNIGKSLALNALIKLNDINDMSVNQDEIFDIASILSAACSIMTSVINNTIKSY